MSRYAPRWASAGTGAGGRPRAPPPVEALVHSLGTPGRSRAGRPPAAPGLPGGSPGSSATTITPDAAGQVEFPAEGVRAAPPPGTDLPNPAIPPPGPRAARRGGSGIPAKFLGAREAAPGAHLARHTAAAGSGPRTTLR